MSVKEDKKENSREQHLMTQFEDIQTINSEDEISDFDHMFMNRHKNKSIDEKDKEEDEVDPKFIEAFFQRDP